MKIITTDPGIQEIVSSLGMRIRAARIRRRLRAQDLASRIGVSRVTVERLERGDAKVSLLTFISALWVMGLAQELELLADPGLDRDGLALSLDVASKRVKRQQALDNDF